MAQRWIVEFVVADSWVADGFQMTDERAVSMIQNELPHAYSHEVTAQVVKSPDPKVIKQLQSGYEEVPAEEFPVVSMTPHQFDSERMPHEGWRV